MRTDLSGALVTEMGSAVRNPASQVTVEQFLPKWDSKISGLSGGELEQFAHGHAAVVAVDGNGAGEDILFRARSGSFANPQDGKLYISVIKDTDLDDPTAWDSLWIDTGITGLMYPAWTANSGAEHGGAIAVAWDSTNSQFRVFYCLANGNIDWRDYDYSGSETANGTVVSFTADQYYFSACQIACAGQGPHELFILRTEIVEQGQTTTYGTSNWTIPDVYGSNLLRYTNTGTGPFSLDSYSFPYHTHAEGNLLRDGPDQAEDFGDDSDDNIILQWGKRPCGGLAVNEIDADTVVISLGLTFWRRWAHDSHNQGLQSFIYHRDSGWWRRGPIGAMSDFSIGLRFHCDVFAKGFAIEGDQFVLWSRYTEPTDYEQEYNNEFLPRPKEVVYSKFDETGLNLTQYQHLGGHDDFTSASIVVINHSGSKKLYAVGWRSISESDPATFLCSVPSPDDLELYNSEVEVRQDNRWGMTIKAPLNDASILFETDTQVKSGNLVRVNQGIEGDMVQVGQGYIDLNTPNISLESIIQNAKMKARADKKLFDVKADTIEDILPQRVVYIPPNDPAEHMAEHRGYWVNAKGTWDDTFFSGQYGLGNTTVRRLLSFPYAKTGGAGGYGDPGDILNARPSYKGTWFQDVEWIAAEPMVDGSMEVSVRFGDIHNQGNFDFVAESGVHTYQTINRTNSLIYLIEWRTGGYGGSIWNSVYQEACMAGILVHAPEIGKKYAFVWEADSSFSASSHTDDTWKAENFDSADYTGVTVGDDNLYLIVSDYEEDDPNWAGSGKWGNIALVRQHASGLSRGLPADLKVQILGGTIYCFYRQTANDGQPPNQWKFAFSYKIGRFGAGKWGIVGRGHAGIQWDVLWPGRSYINKLDNYVDFWNIKVSDNVMDQTLEDILRRYAWRGFTDTVFRSKVDDSSRNLDGSVSEDTYAYTDGVTNLTIDFKLSIGANGEAGVYCRGVDAGTPTDKCIKIGLVPSDTANNGGNDVNYYVVKRRFDGGSEQTTAREYSPVPIQLEPDVPVPVRITARGAIYSIWIAGNYAGHFKDETELGLYFGLYVNGDTADFTDIHVPELYEVPEYALLDIDQAMVDAMKKSIGKRRIKGFFTFDGKLKFSHFDNHDSGPTLEDTIRRSSLKKSDRFLSQVTVEGAYTRATFVSSNLAEEGSRIQVVHMPDIFHNEFCYIEAKAIVAEIAELREQAQFVILPDLRIEPEDEIAVTVSQQNIAGGNYLVDDITTKFKIDDKKPEYSQLIACRGTVVL